MVCKGLTVTTARRLAHGQLAAAANEILTQPQVSFLKALLPLAYGASRCYSVPVSAAEEPQRLVTAYLKGVLSSLSIPHGELDQLVSTDLSDAALTAWALTKTASHPAIEEAAAASHKLQQLLTKLDGAMLWQQQASASPVGQLLWHIAVGASGNALLGMHPEDLQAQSVEFQVVQAMAASASAVDSLMSQLPQLTDMTVTAVLNYPGFWQLAKSAAADRQVLAEDLQLLGYDVAAAASSADTQLQQVQQLLTINAADLQQQLVQEVQADPNILLPGQDKQLLAAVATTGPARQRLAQLQLLQLVSQALGLSSLQVTGPPSAAELVRRLTGVGCAQPAVDAELLQQLSAVAPQLLSAVSAVPVKALEQPSIAGLLQLMNSKPDLQAAAESLTAWRATSAAAGHLPVLMTLSQAEVASLSKEQASRVAAAVMQLEAQGRLLLRRAAAHQLALGSLSEDDAAALAWKVHTGGQAAAEELIRLVLAQAADTYGSVVAKLDSAAAALDNMAVGFQLEDVTSRRSSAAPPSPLVLAGVPQHQIAELSKSFQALTASNTSSAAPASITVETLVRDLAALFAEPQSNSALKHSAAQRLQVVAHDLPKVISGPLLELLATQQSNASTAGAANIQQHQQRLRAFMAVLEAELPKLTDVSPAAAGSTWSGAPGSDVGAGEGVLELLGEQDTAELLQHASEVAGKQSSRRAEPAQGFYEQLADIHQDQEMQRYLQMEFDPVLDVDFVHAPRGWRDADLWESNAEFLDGMKPMLDKYLEAQGEGPINEMEWQVYRDAALAEHEQVEVSTAATRAAAGHSPFNNSRADEAYLTQRLEQGIPKDNVLYAAAHKYLKASFKNRTWRFAQRKRMVDRLIEIAVHLAAHPPRTHRGSPFSPLFQPNGPPAVPRLSRTGRRRARAAADDELYALPDGFGRAAIQE